MCSNSLEKKLKAAKLNNLLPKVVIPVHLSGLPCDMKAIHRLSKKYGFNIVEDASHAIGASYQKNKIGSCNFSDITVFSFHPVKIITTGEGGIALTNNKKLYQKFELFRSHGITRDPNFMTQPPDGLWYYQQLELGYNYRMSDIQAGLGISQMSRIDEYIRKRHNIAEFYDSELKNCSLLLPYHPQDAYSSYHLYIIRLLENNQTASRTICQTKAIRIGVNLHYIPIHTQPFYRNLGFKYGDFPEAESYYNSAISLPIFPTLTKNQQDYVIASLIKLLDS